MALTHEVFYAGHYQHQAAWLLISEASKMNQMIIIIS